MVKLHSWAKFHGFFTAVFALYFSSSDLFSVRYGETSPDESLLLLVKCVQLVCRQYGVGADEYNYFVVSVACFSFLFIFVKQLIRHDIQLVVLQE